MSPHPIPPSLHSQPPPPSHSASPCKAKAPPPLIPSPLHSHTPSLFSRPNQQVFLAAHLQTSKPSSLSPRIEIPPSKSQQPTCSLGPLLVAPAAPPLLVVLVLPEPGPRGPLAVQVARVAHEVVHHSRVALQHQPRAVGVRQSHLGVRPCKGSMIPFYNQLRKRDNCQK
jgi:hypothetical protein